MNTLASFDGNAAYIRPNYLGLVDVVGTQARYVDPSATEKNYKVLSQDGLRNAWCTMCSQEWYR